MSCSACTAFSPPGKAKRIASDTERWVELFKCNACGAFWEVGVLEWHAREIDEVEARRLYPTIFVVPFGR